jgi:hypothetical protein
MNRVVVLVTALHVLLHSIFGCCDHALAAWTGNSGSHKCSHALTTSDHHSRHIHCHHRAVAGHDNEQPQSTSSSSEDAPAVPCDNHDCRHKSCSWLTSEGPPEIHLFESHWNLVYSPVIHAVAESHAASVISPEIDAGRQRALPVRLHLAVGVLLI